VVGDLSAVRRGTCPTGKIAFSAVVGSMFRSVEVKYPLHHCHFYRS